LRSFWTCFNERLWEEYSGVCAYLAIYFDFSTGATTDHFIAKSRSAGDAYEWSNYRLACAGLNNQKNKFDDVLDPVGLAPHTFIIDFASGRIAPNPKLSPADTVAANRTIQRLRLDSEMNNKMRLRHYNKYTGGRWDLAETKEESPFVYEEIIRQGLE
jgi:uncharacterized protein (TIGR02646 family)